MTRTVYAYVVVDAQSARPPQGALDIVPAPGTGSGLDRPERCAPDWESAWIDLGGEG